MNYVINQLKCRASGHAVLGRRLVPVLVLAALVVNSVGCASVPHTGRRQFNFVSDAQLNSLGLKAFQELVSKEPQTEDKRFSEIVKRATDRVAKAAEASDKPKYKWEVRVIERDIPNAFCLPGGKIGVFTGLKQYAKNEAGLAAVIAHEVAHAVARHAGERLSQQLALQGAIAAGGEIMKTEDGKLDEKTRLLLAAIGLGGSLGIVLPYSRVHEHEADRIGQLYMARAGYDPAESVRLWERMAKINKPPIPEWLSTHPADGERVRKLKEYLPDAEKQYSEASTKYGIGEPL